MPHKNGECDERERVCKDKATGDEERGRRCTREFEFATRAHCPMPIHTFGSSDRTPQVDRSASSLARSLRGRGNGQIWCLPARPFAARRPPAPFGPAGSPCDDDDDATPSIFQSYAHLAPFDAVQSLYEGVRAPTMSAMNDPGRNNYPSAVDYPPPGSVISSGSHGRGPPPPGSGQTSPPPPHQTSITVNTDATPGGQVTEINLNLGYFKTLPGILKLVQLVSL